MTHVVGLLQVVEFPRESSIDPGPRAENKSKQVYKILVLICYNFISIFQKDLKRKYSVMPVDEEVRNICAATSKSNFKAFILTSNTSQCEFKLLFLNVEWCF
eukprot:sb/3478371/